MSKEIDKDKIVSESKPLGVLIKLLGLQTIVGKERKNKLSKYKSFNYKDHDGDGYYNVPVYKYKDEYYCSF